jgi:hypothetical protein
LLKSALHSNTTATTLTTCSNLDPQDKSLSFPSHPHPLRKLRKPLPVTERGQERHLLLNAQLPRQRLQLQLLSCLKSALPTNHSHYQSVHPDNIQQPRPTSHVTFYPVTPTFAAQAITCR